MDTRASYGPRIHFAGGTRLVGARAVIEAKRSQAVGWGAIYRFLRILAPNIPHIQIFAIATSWQRSRSGCRGFVVATNQFALQVRENVEGQARRRRASIRQSIRDRLQEIVEATTVRPLPRRHSLGLRGAPPGFQVSEGYHVSYQVNPVSQTVVVLKLRTASD